MAKRVETGIVKVQPDLSLPEYLKDKEVVGVEDMAKYVKPPYLKIVQKQASDELLASHSKGDVLMMPSQAVVAPFGGDETPNPFFFVPLFFWTEWCTWTGIDRPQGVPSIVDRSLHANSELAKKATDSSLWTEEDYEWEGHKLKVRHVEHLNFAVVLYNHELSDIAAVMSFAKAEHKTGRALCSLIKMRKASPFACVFQAQVGKPRSNQKGSWHGYDITNPSAESGVKPWVSQEEFMQFEAMWKETKRIFDEGKLRTEYGEDEVADDPAAVPASTEY